eukprot:1819245-Alexandrium_andersonii.AAC.1
MGYAEADQEVGSLSLHRLADGLELFPRPVQGAAGLREHAQQVAARLGLPQAAPLRLSLEVEGR